MRALHYKAQKLSKLQRRKIKEFIVYWLAEEDECKDSEYPVGLLEMFTEEELAEILLKLINGPRFSLTLEE